MKGRLKSIREQIFSRGKPPVIPAVAGEPEDFYLFGKKLLDYVFRARV
jgi:hypothetical protein